MKKNDDNVLYRTDCLPHGLNPGKEAKVRALFRAWRSVAVQMGCEQWRLLFQTGSFNKFHANAVGKDILPSAMCQMVRRQVVGILESFLANRKNEFADIVRGSNLSEDAQITLLFLNKNELWYHPDPVSMRGTVIPEPARCLARAILRHILSRHRRPDVSRINMVIDQRAVTLTSPETASTFPLWARLSILEKGSPIWVPLRTYSYFDKRKGARALSIQINETRDGELVFGIMTDVSQARKGIRRAYQPKTDILALDLGLTNLFATDQGDLLGRDWIEKLKAYDRRITRLAQYRQSRGLKPRSERYKRYVARLKGFIRSEVGRILNRLVETQVPAEIVIERLNFRRPDLSKRLNRLLQNFGKRLVAAKLQDLEQRFGITITKVPAAYSSQECGCGYVDKRNRPEQRTFRCLWCGSKRHADVNAASNLLHRRSDAVLGDTWRPKQAILSELVRRFGERYTRLKGGPADPRLSNPYFKDWANGMMLTGLG